jgi:hypothetical protein
MVVVAVVVIYVVTTIIPNCGLLVFFRAAGQYEPTASATHQFHLGGEQEYGYRT